MNDLKENGNSYLENEILKEITITEKWWRRLWWPYIYILFLSLTLSIIIPFGLAILLYVPPQYVKNMNIFLLIVSAISLIIQVVLSSLRFRERALRMRRNHGDLKIALTKYKAGEIDDRELLNQYERLVKSTAEEEVGGR